MTSFAGRPGLICGVVDQDLNPWSGTALGVSADLFECVGVAWVLPGGEGAEIDASSGLPWAGGPVFASLVACGVEADLGVDELLMSFCAGGEGDEPVDGHLDRWA